MKLETDPITDDESLLRRVRFERFKADKNPIISPNAFEPRTKGREPDDDGISLYREACMSSPSDILATVEPCRRHEYGIVRIAVRQLRSLNLTVKISPDTQIRGHVVIPELNARDYKADKSAFTSIKDQLAIWASADENIVRWPSEQAESEPPSA